MVVGMEEAVMQEIGAGKPELAEELSVPMVEVVVAEESADESEAQDGKEEADNEDKVPVTPKRVLTVSGSGPLPAVSKRASKLTTPSKRCSQKVVPQYKSVGTQLALSCVSDAMPSKGLCNFKKVVLVQQTRKFVLEQWKLREKAVISVESMVLPTAQELGIVVKNVDLVSGTPERKGGSEASERDPPVAGPSWQIIPIEPIKQVLPLGSVMLSNPKEASGKEDSSGCKSVAELSKSSESSSKVQAFPRPTEFLWLRKALDYSISALHPAQYIEAAREKAEGMAEVLQKDM
ncbi:hypothetical protein C0992_007009 [Termitomyces sp. T32_za158]|nr:hypothetical protein C0992_007009 [Termitomyces sp. T32_za158]